MQNRNKHLLFMVQFAILAAIEAIFCFTPLGSLPAIGPIVATLAMVPVIITAILLGTAAGTAMGALAGLFSFLVWTFTPPNPMMAFVFTPFYSAGEISGNLGSVLICFLPRILTGTMAGLLYRGMAKVAPGKEVLACSVSAVVGSMTNTLLVMAGIWVFFGAQYSTLVGQAMIAVIGVTILTSGIPEAVVAAVAASAVCKPIKYVLSRQSH